LQNIGFSGLKKMTKHINQESAKPVDILVLNGDGHLGDLGADKRRILNLILPL
jgi:hypothetical protein